MKIRIIDYSVDSNEVRFSSEYGTARGIWRGEKIEDREYYVEINIPGKVSKLDVRAVNDNVPRIFVEKNIISIIGRLEDIEVGYATLVVGDSLIMLELEKGNFELFENKYVQLNVTYIELYDEGLN